MTDFYEEDESVEDIVAAFDAGVKYELDPPIIAVTMHDRCTAVHPLAGAVRCDRVQGHDIYHRGWAAGKNSRSSYQQVFWDVETP